MVAEKNRVWRVNGTIFTMRSISGMKPMSSMRSASSITRSSTPLSSSLPRSMWSSSRPGVAMSTSTPRAILASWSPNDTPPMSRATLSLWLMPYLSKFSCTCAASSRVGSRISVRGMRARARPLSRRRQHRQHEGGGLAGSGLGDAEDVAAGEDMRDGLRLDRRRLRVTGGCDSLKNFLAKSEVGERHEEYNRLGSGGAFGPDRTRRQQTGAKRVLPEVSAQAKVWRDHRTSYRLVNPRENTEWRRPSF